MVTENSIQSHLPWYRIWWTVLVQPAPGRFAEMSLAAKRSTAFWWYVAAALFLGWGLLFSSGRAYQLLWVGYVILLALHATISATLARIVGGTGSFNQQHVASGAIVVVTTVMLLPVAALLHDVTVYLTLFAGWTIALSIVATRGAHDVPWGTAALVNLFTFALLGLLLVTFGTIMADMGMLDGMMEQWQENSPFSLFDLD